MTKILSKTFYTLGLSSLLIAIVLSTILFGGWWYPIFSIPSVGLVAIALLLMIVASLFTEIRSDQTGGYFYSLNPLCSGSFFALTAYVYWRILQTPDTYAARDNLWLLLGAIGCYLISALYIRKPEGYWAWLLAILITCLTQLAIVVWQYQATSPIHPLFNYANWFSLPDGSTGKNLGYVTGTFFSRGTLSAFLLTGLLFSISTALWAKCHVAIKIILFWIGLCCLVGIAISMSRAAYIASASGLLCLFALSIGLISRYSITKRWVLLTILTTIILPCLLVLFVLFSENFSLAQRLKDIGNDPYRETLWYTIVPSMLNKSPLIGTGANSFDFLSTQLATAQLASRSVHAHNDWLQLFIEYGAIGLFLAVICFLIHLAIGIKGSYKIASERAYQSIIPQGAQIAATVGSFSTLISLGTHCLFDYQIHLLSIVMVAGCCAGMLCSCKESWDINYRNYIPRRSVLLASKTLSILVMTILSLYILKLCYQHYLPELHALKSESSLTKGNVKKANENALQGLNYDPQNPRLLILAAESSGQYGNTLKDENLRLQWYKKSANKWLKALNIRPNFAYAAREAAMTLDWSRNPKEALPLHLRAISLNPQSALGYEYLALHYYLQGELNKAKSLLSLSQTMPGSRLSQKYLPIINEEIKKESVNKPTN